MSVVSSILNDGAHTFQQRNPMYGDSYLHFGPLMLALFPDGLHAKSAEDFARLGVIVHCAGKLSRYCANFDSGGHIDSAHDLMVYAAMLQSITNI